MKPLYEEKGAGQFGFCWLFSWGGSYPLAKLQIYRDRAVLSIWPFKLSMKIKDIESINENGLGGIKINRHGSLMRYVAFYPYPTWHSVVPDSNKMKKAFSVFRKLGVKVTK